MARRRLIMVRLLLMAALLPPGCGVMSETDALIIKTNRSDKHFKGRWVHLLQSPASQTTEPVSDVLVTVDGMHWSMERHGRSTMDGRAVRTWVFDGRRLCERITDSRVLQTGRFKPEKACTPWTMPLRMRPFGTPALQGEAGIAGRDCVVLGCTGTRDQAQVRLTYWIDKDEYVVLKKEHVIGPEEWPLHKEVFECIAIEYNPGLEAGCLECTAPEGWTGTEVPVMECALQAIPF
ncbi:hypothetical protein JW905_18540 [bacterium]|nr:hypothetical protein [candidate division CSSED10-310 bacterium]